MGINFIPLGDAGPEKNAYTFPSFGHITSQNQRAHNWLQVMESILPDLLSRLDQESFQRAVIGGLPPTSQINTASLSSGNLSFRSFPHIRHITGTDIPVCTLSFSDPSSYARFMGQIGYRTPPQGVAIRLDAGRFLAAMNIPDFPEPLRAIHMVAYCEKQLPDSMPPAQILQHETVHAIDPLLDTRQQPDTLIITEMIATIGEFASVENDLTTLNSLVSFWESYLKKITLFSPEFFTVFNLQPDASISETAEAIRKFVSQITLKYRNTDLVRMLMSCTSFADLLRSLQELMPVTYQDVSPKSSAIQDAVGSTRSDITRTEKAPAIPPNIQTVLRYYRNWPDAYLIQKRSISSLWMQAPYGDQAMNTFLNNDISLGLETLQALAKTFNLSFDTASITAFRVTRRAEGKNHRIVISW